jgi:uncharacterized integral membrane protein (TIGR00697 family)
MCIKLHQGLENDPVDIGTIVPVGPWCISLAAVDLESMAVAQRRQRWLIVGVGAYVAASLVANIASVRQVEILGLAVDAGTLTYPLTFTLRDLIHKVAGRSAARTTILLACVANIAMVGALWAASALPADLAVGPQVEFGHLLVPAGRIAIASVLAALLAELADTEIYHHYVMRFGHRFQWGRVLTSNAVSIPMDSVLFTLVAFAGDLPRSVVIEIIVANVIIKGLTTFVTWPLIYAVPELDPELSSARFDETGSPRSSLHASVEPGSR